MDDDLDDPDLRAAIAASLGEPLQPDVVDLTADSGDDAVDDVVPIFPKSNSLVGSETDSGDDEENSHHSEDDEESLKKAIALSMQDLPHEADSSGPQNPSVKNDSRETPNELPTDANISSKRQQDSSLMGLLGLDRKQMERERVARLAKRKADDSPTVEQRDAKHPKSENAQAPAPVVNRPNDASFKGTNASSVQFPLGTVKKTWVFGQRRLGDDIKIEEVFQKSDLKVAILSSFLWDTEWVFSKFPNNNVTKATRFLFVMQAKEAAMREQYERETADIPELRLCFPPMEGQINCMHSKLMLLFHPGHLRIAVPSANLTPFDWGESGGIMENTVFLIDLPKITESSSDTTKTSFYHELVYFLKASTLHENMISKLNEYDFSETKRIAFIHTIGGSHTGEAWRRTGHCGLGRAVEALGLQTSSPLNMDIVTSSIGSLTDEFMRSMYLASQGDDGMTEYTIRNVKTVPAHGPSGSTRLIHRNTADEWKERLRVYFPSISVIEGSKGGPMNGGTICFQSKWYSDPKFPRQVLRDCESQRPGLLMHNKADHDGSQCRAWAYVGSGNLSESAWGRLVKDRSTKQPKLNCRNWECGVLVPLIDENPKVVENGANFKVSSSEQSISEANKESANMLDVFDGTIPVPMRLPGARYGPTRKPWFFMETRI
ncbi:hypothetical protein FE257_001656 [Aspergillus nanangensis]|uniref:Uncharacterized protein n=1 Tax=Aspergillus nanangensis TaxID=2582783 RepID=A0AAD4CVM1_ASPNN|nr:hypothetical protein FE257_001656 [Aspergillus nanangensis]